MFCVLPGAGPQGSAAAPECQLIPREGPVNSNSVYQSFSGVFYSQKGVVWPFSPFVNSLWSASPCWVGSLVFQTCIQQMALPCVVTVLCSPQELGCSQTASSEDLGAQGQSVSAVGLSTESVHDATQRVEEKQPSPSHFVFLSSAKLIPDPRQKSLNPLFIIPFYYFF